MALTYKLIPMFMNNKKLVTGRGNRSLLGGGFNKYEIRALKHLIKFLEDSSMVQEYLDESWEIDGGEESEKMLVAIRAIKSMVNENNDLFEDSDFEYITKGV